MQINNMLMKYSKHTHVHHQAELFLHNYKPWFIEYSSILSTIIHIPKLMDFA